MSLLERFQKGSELDSHGQFTLDESKAREKMARFQLVTHEEFLMLVVQAAVAAHCSALNITLEGNEIRVMAHQAVLDGDSLRSLRPFLFDSQPENVAYNLLAVAANAVEPSCLTPPLVAMVDDDLHFEAHLKQSLGDLSRMLATRLRHFPYPLSLNGNPVETDPLPDDGLRIQLDDSTSSSVVLVRYGVVVGHKPRMLLINYEAVAKADHLALDASFSQVVEDASFGALLQTLDSRANELLAIRAQGYQPEAPETRTLLAHLQADHPDPAGKALRQCRFFPYADRPGYASLDEIRKLISTQGKLMVSHRSYNLQLDTPVIRIDDGVLGRVIRAKVPANSTQDAGPAFIAKAAADRNRAQWEASPRPTELPPGRYLGQGKLEGLTWEAAVGFLAAPGGPSRIDVLYQGKLLNSEALSDVPPGSTAVLNVRQAEVHPSWTRLDGREYRGILKELRERIIALFGTQTIQNPEDLYPQLSAYLLGLASVKKPPAVARHAPLFPTTDGRKPMTLLEVSRLKDIAFGDIVFLSDAIPASEILPSPLLLYDQARLGALSTALGSRVRDVRAQQARLTEIESQMNSPRQAVLPVDTESLSRAPFRFDSSHGEVALRPGTGGKLEATLMKGGAVFETVTSFAGRLLPAVAIVESPQLTLNAYWNGFIYDAHFTEMQDALRDQVLRMEVELLERPIDPELKLKLVRAYPQEKERYWNQELFETTVAGRRVSFARLQAEISEHGCLLRGEPGMTLPNRLVMRTPNKDTNGLLFNELGEFRWEDAAFLIRQYEQAQEFEQRQVHKEIRLTGEFPIRLPLPSGRGELGLHPYRTQGEVQCFVRGRYVCVKKDVVPAPFIAAVESESLVMHDDYRNVTIPAVFREMLADLCGQAMLLAAVHSNLELRKLAWDYFGGKNAQRLSEFQESVTFRQLTGEPVTLATVARAKIRGYVSPRFTTGLTPKGLILRLDPEEVTRLSGFLRRELNHLEKEFEADERLLKRLAALPKQLPVGLYQKRFESEGYAAVIGLSQLRKTVGLDDKGQPVGVLRDLVMPVQAIVWGAHPKNPKEDELCADLPPKGWNLVGQWSEQLCLDWVKEKADDGVLLRQLLLLSMREIGSRNNRPLSELASILWDMPLFGRVDGTRVSGSALAATLTEMEQPILVSAATFRIPGQAVYLPDGSDERAILSGVFGKSQLQWYEAPPFIDPAELTESVKRLVSWGLSPFSRSISAVGKLLEKGAQKKKEEEPKKKRGPRELLVVALKEDVANLLGREHFKKSNELFRALDYGKWPLGPPVYRRSDGAFRLNDLNSGIRWLLSDEGDERHKRAARILLLVHWVGLVNEASEELRDDHEDAFLERLAERMTQTFTSDTVQG